MSMQDLLDALGQAMSKFSTTYKNALTAKAKDAYQADNTALLAGSTLTQVTGAMEAPLDAHAARTDNPHFDSVTSINGYSRAQIDSIFGALPQLTNVPISRFGELGYLPVGVSGDFQGASTNLESRAYNLIIEDDGTLVMLRNGTTGSVQGVYYAYSKNILGPGTGAGALSPMNRSTRRYAPGYFPSGYTARYLARGDGGVLVGRLQDSSGNLGDWFISITGGTFDDTKHVGCLVQAADMPTMFQNDPKAPDTHSEAFLSSDAVYIVVPPTCTDSSVALEFQIWKIPLSSILAGGYVTPTQITSWNCAGFYGTVTSTGIRLAPRVVSTNSADQPFIVDSMSPVTGGSVTAATTWDEGFRTVSAYDPVTHQIRTAVFGSTYYNKEDVGLANIMEFVFSFTWDPNAKTAALDSAFNTPGTVQGTLGAADATFSGSIYQFQRNVAKFIPTNYANAGQSYYYHPAGWWLGVSDSNQPDFTITYGRGKIAAAVSKYAALNFAANPIVQNDYRTYDPSYGSAIGGVILGSTPLPNDWLLLYCRGKNAAGSTQSGLVLAQKGGASTYGSLQYGSLSGYAPTVNRKFVSDLGLDPMIYSSAVAEINAAGVVSVSAGQFAEGYSVPHPLSINEALATSGSIAISASLYASVRNAMWAVAGLSPSVKGAYTTFVVPQNTALPCFASVTWVDTAGNEYALFGELSVTGGSRTTTITGFSVVSVSAAQKNTQNGGPASGIVTDNTTYMETCGVTIYEASDCWVVSGTGKHLAQRPGWNGSYNYKFAVPKSSNRPDWSNLGVGWFWEHFSTQFFTAVPGVGFGLCDQRLIGSDYNTKLLFKLMGTDLASFNAKTIQPQSTWKVLASQDVAQGWIVYFTDTVPVVMNGQVIQLQPTTIDLSTLQADPSNKTWYVYIWFSAGKWEYHISYPTKQQEQPNVMFIGTITTGASSITSINIQKVSRIGNYRLSTRAVGSAISVSSGTPDQAAHLNWT